MKLAAKYDVDAPVDFVFRELMDFDAWERMAIRRGAEVVRSDTLATPGAGMEWLANFTYRGKPRSAKIRLETLTKDSLLGLKLRSSLVDVDMAIELLDLAVARTRITVRSEVKPKTIAARIYLQTLRLARKKVDAAYAQRIAQLAVEMEDRYRRPALR